MVYNEQEQNTVKIRLYSKPAFAFSSDATPVQLKFHAL